MKPIVQAANSAMPAVIPAMLNYNNELGILDIYLALLDILNDSPMWAVKHLARERSDQLSSMLVDDLCEDIDSYYLNKSIAVESSEFSLHHFTLFASIAKHNKEFEQYLSQIRCFDVKRDGNQIHLKYNPTYQMSLSDMLYRDAGLLRSIGLAGLTPNSDMRWLGRYTYM